MKNDLVDQKTVIVCHPGAQHSHRLAIALQESGMLKWYLTGLYTAWNQKPFSYLKYLPSNLKIKIEQTVFEKFRRYSENLSEDYVITVQPYKEAYVAIRSRLGATDKWRAAKENKNSVIFQRKIVNFALKAQTKILVCYDKNAFETFKILDDSGIICLLDQSTAHPAFHEEMLREERLLSPDFADSIILPSEKTYWYKDWCDESEIADYILAGSSFVKRTLVNNGISADKIFTANYGVDTELFSEKEYDKFSGKFRVLFVGGIMQRKGIAYLLEAVKRLDLPGIELILCGNILGSGDGLRSYSGYYNHIGSMPHKLMPKVYQRADVFVMPSLIEGLAQVNLEALASGLPIITTANSGAADFLEDGIQGFLVPIRDPESIAERIEYLYKNRDKCIKMGIEGRQLAVRNSWEKYNDRIDCIFSKLLS